jgi:CheY-like chemotaxis protein
MSSSSLIDLSGVRVLCVDDDPLIRSVVRAALHARGCRSIEQAQDGPAALALCASREFDLIICDYQMAPMDGLAFLRALCEAGHGAGWPVVMLSAEADPATITAARDLGISAWVPKPVSVVRLIERVGAALGPARLAAVPAHGVAPDPAMERCHTQILAALTSIEELLATLPYRQRELAAQFRQMLNAFDQVREQARMLGYGLVEHLADRAASLLAAAERQPALLRRRWQDIATAIASLVTAIRRVAQKRLSGDGGVSGLKLLNAVDDSLASLREALPEMTPLAH